MSLETLIAAVAEHPVLYDLTLHLAKTVFIWDDHFRKYDEWTTRRRERLLPRSTRATYERIKYLIN